MVSVVPEHSGHVNTAVVSQRISQRTEDTPSHKASKNTESHRIVVLIIVTAKKQYLISQSKQRICPQSELVFTPVDHVTVQRGQKEDQSPQETRKEINGLQVRAVPLVSLLLCGLLLFVEVRGHDILRQQRVTIGSGLQPKRIQVRNRKHTLGHSIPMTVSL